MAAVPFAASRPRTSLASLAAFVLGIPVGLVMLMALTQGPWRIESLQRYLAHPIVQAEVVLFCCAAAALVVKALLCVKERWVLTRQLLPDWNGKAHPAAEADALLRHLVHQPPLLRSSLAYRRIAAVLGFVSHRGSANELDDQMRSLADADALHQDGSFSLLRFITWAIPILGFLGTVVGITQAIAGVTPQALERSLNTVTDGLAEAFDTTAAALCLTMVLMFASFLVDRWEQTLLGRVDDLVDAELAHRFERTGPESAQFIESLRQNTGVLLQAVEQLVERQATLWSQTLHRADRHWSDLGEKQKTLLVDSLTLALRTTQEEQERRLQEMERKLQLRNEELLAGLEKVTAALDAKTTALARLQDGEEQLLRLQDALQQNLAVLAGSGSFDQAVQSLTAAIHLLTGRVSPGSLPSSRAAA